MGNILFVGIFVLIIAWLFSVYLKVVDGFQKDDTDSREKGSGEEIKIETPEYDEESPTNTC
ncbi:MAG: hypothetical protein JSW20_00235 [Nitrospiraceae bacterium]|nr:MAG: hypothetical protein JSW20_00235 [Nitrospiraceae bacterium]